MDEPGVSAERIAQIAEKIQLDALRRSKTRDEAIAYGAALGADEADRRKETGADREGRVARAKAYAAWEWDGKPAGGAHLREFGVARPDLGLRALGGGDFKQGKTK